MKPLEGKVAVVAGATRGAGRGIACMLGEAGATVYCTGRSVRGHPSPYGRPETIEETAEMVTARGGVGIWAQVDHTEPEQVQALFERVGMEQGGQLDVLVNDLSGDWDIGWDVLTGEVVPPFWECSVERELLAHTTGVLSHMTTSHYGARLMVERRQGLIAEINDGNGLGWRGHLGYSLIKDSAILLAYYMSMELREHGVAAVAITPGYLRSEVMLERKGVTELNWQDYIEEDVGWRDSESPFYVGRAVAALAADPNIMDKSGMALSSGWLARDYGFTDVDGRQPPGYYPKEGVFDRYRRSFQLQAPGLSALERLGCGELLELARGIGIPDADRFPTPELLEVVKRVDPHRLEGKVKGRFV